MKRPPMSPAGRRDGVTLVELVVVVSVLVIALGELSRSLLAVSRLEPANRETSVALQAARSTLERVRALPFEELFERLNTDSDDDPDGPGTASGPNFVVPGLDLRADDPDGCAGRIELPILADELREDFGDSDLGMPRDLNGDGVVDALDHSSDHDVLPVRIVVEWRGASGDRRISLSSTLTELP